MSIQTRGFSGLYAHIKKGLICVQEQDFLRASKCRYEISPHTTCSSESGSNGVVIYKALCENYANGSFTLYPLLIAILLLLYIMPDIDCCLFLGKYGPYRQSGQYAMLHCF